MIAKVFAGIVLAFVAIVAFGLEANDRAARRARAFCETIREGMPEAAAIASGRAAASRHQEGSGAHRFVFQGWVFNASTCVIGVASGRVVSVSVQDERD